MTPATYTRHGLTETEAMNLLQEAGIVSDNCVWIKDIAEADLWKAVSFFENYGGGAGTCSEPNNYRIGRKDSPAPLPHTR